MDPNPLITVCGSVNCSKSPGEGEQFVAVIHILNDLKGWAHPLLTSHSKNLS